MTRRGITIAAAALSLLAAVAIYGNSTAQASRGPKFVVEFSTVTSNAYGAISLHTYCPAGYTAINGGLREATVDVVAYAGPGVIDGRGMAPKGGASVIPGRSWLVVVDHFHVGPIGVALSTAPTSYATWVLCETN